jgi:gliding motility-associated lipoprotein GldH
MTGKINKIAYTATIALLLMIASCNSNVIFTDSVAIPDNTWSLTNIPVFTMPVTDTSINTNIFFTIRTGSEYPFRNIYLFVTASSPNGKSICDTLEFNLADEKGNWYGRGFGDIKELNLPFKSNVFFPLKGNYQFKVQHGMRIGDLKGIYDFGLRIEKVSR